MLIQRAVLDGIVSGDYDLALRRWQRPSVKIGTRQRTAVGIIEVTSLTEIGLDAIGDNDAARAGAASAAGIRDWLGTRDGTVYRIGLTYAGPDPRVELRDAPIRDQAEYAEIANALGRYDESSRWGPWTLLVLQAIDAARGTPAQDLADRFGREKRLFKTDVRKLKELGLTESLNPGYRLSPRGESYLRWSAEADDG